MERALIGVVAAAATFALAAGAQAATPEQKATYRAQLRQATADYNAAAKGCRAMRGNERTVCFAEAKAELARADAQARAAYIDSPHAKRDARVAEADADYAVAKAKCGDKERAERKTCVDEARAARQQAIATAMRETP